MKGEVFRHLPERFSYWRTEKIDKKYQDLRTSSELKNIPDEKFPQSVVIIPDGNRREAQKLGISKEEGHKRGAEKVIDLLRAFSTLPIHSVTVWGFSTDNWKRDPGEISYLMRLMNATVENYLPELIEKNGRLIHLGRKDRIPFFLCKTLVNAEIKTKNNTGQIAGLAIDFGGEDQMARMVELARNNPHLSFEELRDGKGIIQPADLIIRTGDNGNGLVHTSDIGWLNGKPTQIYSLSKSFPQLTRQDVAQAISAYAITQRRQGK